MEDMTWVDGVYVYGWDDVIDPSKPLHADYTTESYRLGKINHMRSLAQSNLFLYYRSEYGGSPPSTIFDMATAMMNQLSVDSLITWSGAIRLGKEKGKK